MQRFYTTLSNAHLRPVLLGYDGPAHCLQGHAPQTLSAKMYRRSASEGIARVALRKRTRRLSLKSQLLVPMSKEIGHRSCICESGSTYEFGHEGNHEVEQTNGLDEGETQNGVREELATEGGVAGDAVDEGSEDETDTDTGTSQTDGGRAHTQVPGDLNHGLGDLGRVGTAALDVECLAGGGIDDRGHLLALEGLERRGLAGTCEESGW